MRKVCCLTSALMVCLIMGSTIAAEKKAEEPMMPALVVMDIQNQYLPMMSDEGKDQCLRMTNGAIHLFRKYGYPVIRVYHTSPEFGPQPGTEAFQFPESIMITDDDPMIVKNYPSAFTKTELQNMLREKKCNTVFLCGLSAVGCVLATYFGAVERDFDVFMVENALLSHDASYTDMVEDITGAVSYEALRVMLVNAGK